jgi:hypothetical protein
MDYDSVPFPRLVRQVVAAHDTLAERIRQRLTWKSSENRYWLTVQGLLMSSQQAFLGVCFLVSESATWRGDQRPGLLAAIAVSRTLLDTLGNLLCLTEDRERRTNLYQRADYRDRWRRIAKARTRLNDPRTTAWCNREEGYLREYADYLGLSASERSNPSVRWPRIATFLNPTQLDPTGRRWLSGTAHESLVLLETEWYADLSRVAHAEGGAVSAAFLVERTAAPRDVLVRDVFFPAALFHLSVLTEIERAGRWPNGPRTALRRGWGLMTTALVAAIECFALRHREELEFMLEPPGLTENWEGRFG